MIMLCIKNGLIHDAVSATPYVGDILVENGKITQILPANSCKDAETVIDATGLNVYPGLVDAHSHLGLDGYAIGFEGQDYNEMNDILTPQLRAIDGINPQDETLQLALEGGVTCVGTGPGSSNVLGGMFVAMKPFGRRIDDMIVKFPVAMKCAFGENPKRCYKDKNNYSRMSTASKLREMLFKAREYQAKLDAAAEDPSKKPAYDMKLEALLPVLRREIPLKAHAHRADDIFTAIRIAKEFGIKMTMDHCSEGHLVAEELAKEGFPAIVGPDLTSRNKIEVQNMSFKTAGVLNRAGVMVAITTDHPVSQIQTLPLCAGLAVKAGLPMEEGFRAITIYPAKICGVADRIGSLEVGKDADIAIFDGNPMEIFTRTLYTIINGEIVYCNVPRE